MRSGLAFLLLGVFFAAHAQDIAGDSIQILQPVLIQAYATDRPLEEVAASVGYIDGSDLNRFSNTNILPAVNTIPGVRMEERSPGSYRFSIRGSLLRSPFGVRNVKAYWNGLPLTDGGGNTYLNLLDFGSIGSMEVIKGPAGSLYGAGTGGVILLNSPRVRRDESEFSAIAGSFGLRRFNLSQQVHNPGLSLRVQFAGHHYDGYRQQSEMTRYAVNGDVVVPVASEGTLSATFFYSDLYYQTPGGLTRTQYDEDPRQARPAAGANRGAVEQKAAVYNQTPFLGITYEHEWNNDVSTRVGVFGSRSDFRNPAVRNYEIRDERNFGLRTETNGRIGPKNTGKITFGGEIRFLNGPVTVYDNESGDKGPIQTDDDLASRFLLLFGQAEWDLSHEVSVTLGGSIHMLEYDFRRPGANQTKQFDPFFSPRIAVLKKVAEKFSVYANISRGFSPPSLAEVRPSTNAFNSDLQAERGTNYEAGFRGAIPGAKIFVDVTVYDFRLRETIIVQRLADGADYFVNAGKTSQQGIEALLAFTPVKNGKGWLSGLKLWNSYAYNRYRFSSYVNDATDYSGNHLTGVPPVVNTSGVDLAVRQRFHANVTINYVDHIPLNDANSVYAEAYWLLGARAGYEIKIKDSHPLEIFAGVDNALDEKYSLGNDLNAIFGGRYFNAAAPRNYYAGVRLTLAQ